MPLALFIPLAAIAKPNSGARADARPFPAPRVCIFDKRSNIIFTPARRSFIKGAMSANIFFMFMKYLDKLSIKSPMRCPNSATLSSFLISNSLKRVRLSAPRLMASQIGSHALYRTLAPSMSGRNLSRSKFQPRRKLENQLPILSNIP